MTAPATTDAVLQWMRLLPEDVRRHVNSTHALAHHVRAALAHGWTVQQLADEAARDHATSRRIASVVTARMEQAAQGLPPRQQHTPFARYVQPLAKCPACDPNRFVETERDGRTVLVRCPTCWTPPPTKEATP